MYQILIRTGHYPLQQATPPARSLWLALALWLHGLLRP
jgi:hypothetical protein